MKQNFKWLASVLLAVVFVLSPFAERGLAAYASGEGTRNPIPGASSSKATTTTEKTSKTAAKTATASTKYPHAGIVKKITPYQEKSKDVKGWLTVPGTNMDFPVMQSAKDNKYYEDRTWDGTNYPNNNWKNYKKTAEYLDYRTKIGATWATSSRNFVIYGHNWTNLRDPMAIGTKNRHEMFGQLPSYTDIEFAKKNPYIYFSTGENEGIWKVFAVAYINSDPKIYNHNSPNPSDEAFATIIKESKLRSLHNFEVDVNTTDTLLTLSTCTRKYPKNASSTSYIANQRYIVVARLLRAGEADTEAVTVAANPKVKEPTFK